MNKQSLHFLKQLAYLACILLTLTSCEKNTSTPVSDTIDYSNPQCWFENKQDAMGKDVDLFYGLGESFHPIGQKRIGR